MRRQSESCGEKLGTERRMELRKQGGRLRETDRHTDLETETHARVRVKNTDMESTRTRARAEEKERDTEREYTQSGKVAEEKREMKGLPRALPTQPGTRQQTRVLPRWLALAFVLCKHGKDRTISPGSSSHDAQHGGSNSLAQHLP